MAPKETQVFGYNRQEVDDFLQQLTEEYRREKAALASKIELAKASVSSLAEKQQALLAKRQQDIAGSDLWRLASAQLGVARAALLREMEQIAAEERELLEQRLGEAELVCQELDREIAAREQQISEMLHGFQALLETAAPAAPAREAAPQPAAPATELLMAKGREPVVARAALGQNASRPAAPFWDDDLEAIIRQVDAPAAATAGQPPPAPPPAVSAPATADPGDQLSDSAASQPLPSDSQHQQQPEAAAAPASQAAVGPASPAVASEIRGVRHRYILGKIAGCDLLDQAGSLLVAKGATISKEIALAAEAAGLLPELIINMQLPEPGEP